MTYRPNVSGGTLNLAQSMKPPGASSPARTAYVTYE